MRPAEVDQHPDQLAKGQDPQLDKAVDVLTQDVLAWKKARTPATPAVAKPTGPAAPPVVPVPMGK